MKLLNLNINQYLLLEDFPFANQNNNIDYLNNSAILSTNLDEQISLLNLATNKIEKFHSFFHFQQSFFHLQLALLYLKTNNQTKAKEQLELAIFQDHENKQAIAILNNLEEYNIYQLPYKNFSEYLNFATEEPGEYYYKNSYWDSISSTNLEEIIKKTRYLHLNYHQESAKLYLNRAVIFHYLNQTDLAKNDLTKANNLDSQLKERHYYNSMISQLSSKVTLGLGSNLGNRNRNLKQAIDTLKDMNILSNVICSSIDETKAILKPGSPKAWNIDYLNQTITGLTMLNPQELLKALKDIEHIMGRTSLEEWSPREIDIDILSYKDQIIEEENLIIPHPEILNRHWILKQLSEINPQWKYPILGRFYQLTIKEIYEKH